jgi:hypothetical protein
MSEALWAQIISGFFGLVSAVLVARLPRRNERRRLHGRDPAENEEIMP